MSYGTTNASSGISSNMIDSTGNNGFITAPLVVELGLSTPPVSTYIAFGQDKKLYVLSTTAVYVYSSSDDTWSATITTLAYTISGSGINVLHTPGDACYTQAGSNKNIYIMSLTESYFSLLLNNSDGSTFYIHWLRPYNTIYYVYVSGYYSYVYRTYISDNTWTSIANNYSSSYYDYNGNTTWDGYNFGTEGVMVTFTDENGNTLGGASPSRRTSGGYITNTNGLYANNYSYGGSYVTEGDLTSALFTFRKAYSSLAVQGYILGWVITYNMANPTYRIYPAYGMTKIYSVGLAYGCHEMSAYSGHIALYHNSTYNQWLLFCYDGLLGVEQFSI